MRIAIGDIHGRFENLEYNISNHGIKNSHIFIAGDVGLGFQDWEKDLHNLKALNLGAKEDKNIFYLVRGNHDNPEIWNKDIDLSNVKLVKDYEYIDAEGKKVLCVGGAVSIDRYSRIEGKSFWENEKTIYKKMNDMTDFVISHDSPMFCLPPFSRTNYNIINTGIIQNRDILSNVYRDIKPIKGWYYAHYHQSFTQFIDNAIFKCLNVEEMCEMK